MLRNVTFGSGTSRTRSMFASLIMSVSKVKSDLLTTRNLRKGGVRKAISISVSEYTCQDLSQCRHRVTVSVATN